MSPARAIVALPAERGYAFAIARDRTAIAELCALLESAIGIDASKLDALRALQLAFDELLTNVVTHADGGDGEPMGVLVDADDAGLRAEIRYRADCYDPTARAAPDTSLAIADRAIGGLGVHLVQQLMARFEHRYEAGYNVLVLERPWQFEGAAPSPPTP